MEENRNTADREEIICWCSNVSRGQIWDAMAGGARTLRVMREYLAGQAKPEETDGEK